MTSGEQIKGSEAAFPEFTFNEAGVRTFVAQAVRLTVSNRQALERMKDDPSVREHAYDWRRKANSSFEAGVRAVCVALNEIAPLSEENSTWESYVTQQVDEQLTSDDVQP